jgi:hypothetical protein
MASSNNPTIAQGPILMGMNYDAWSIKMKNFLKSEDCWEAIVNGFQEPDQMDLQTMTNAQINSLVELRNTDSKALWLIQQGLEEYIFPKVTAVYHAKQA